MNETSSKTKQATFEKSGIYIFQVYNSDNGSPIPCLSHHCIAVTKDKASGLIKSGSLYNAQVQKDVVQTLVFDFKATPKEELSVNLKGGESPNFVFTTKSITPFGDKVYATVIVTTAKPNILVEL